MEEILEEEFIESCFEDMLEEEALGLFSPPNADGDTIDDGIPSLHSLSIDSGAISDLDADGVVAGESGIVEEQDITWRGTAEGVAPSGFGGHDSEGESDVSIIVLEKCLNTECMLTVKEIVCSVAAPTRVNPLLSLCLH